jgi:hypothetical protein
MWRVVLLNDQTWDMRFRLIGVELMQAPLFGLALLQLGLLLYLPRFSASSNLFDLLFTRRRTAAYDRIGTPSAIASRHTHHSLSTQDDGDDANGDGEEESSRGHEGEDEDEENVDGIDGEWDASSGQSVASDDLAGLLARASQVGSVSSPIAFFQAQALREMGHV